MKIRDVINENVGTTSAGSIATVAAPIGGMIARSGDSFFSGKYTTDADPYPNTPAYMKKKKGKKRVS